MARDYLVLSSQQASVTPRRFINFLQPSPLAFAIASIYPKKIKRAPVPGVYSLVIFLSPGSGQKSS
jgi:hypothetical protein